MHREGLKGYAPNIEPTLGQYVFIDGKKSAENCE